MKRLLTGYAMHYNRRHQRNGHLFQNRYKSILCQQDCYLLELERYIHLNPLRAKLVSDMKELGQNRSCGHGVLMGKVVAEWQDTAYILKLFGGKPSIARRRYGEFVQKGIAAGSATRPHRGWTDSQCGRVVSREGFTDGRGLAEGR